MTSWARYKASVSAKTKRKLRCKAFKALAAREEWKTTKRTTITLEKEYRHLMITMYCLDEGILSIIIQETSSFGKEDLEPSEEP